MARMITHVIRGCPSYLVSQHLLKKHTQQVFLEVSRIPHQRQASFVTFMYYNSSNDNMNAQKKAECTSSAKNMNQKWSLSLKLDEFSSQESMGAPITGRSDLYIHVGEKQEQDYHSTGLHPRLAKIHCTVPW